MERLSFPPGTVRPFLGIPPPNERENTMGDSSFTKAGRAATQNMGARSLLRNNH